MSRICGLALLSSSLSSGTRWGWAKVKKIIPLKGMQRERLIGRNPADLDTRNLDVTPLKDFGTMGLRYYGVNLDMWRLEVTNHVKESLSLNYSQLVGLHPLREKYC